MVRRSVASCLKSQVAKPHQLGQQPPPGQRHEQSCAHERQQNIPGLPRTSHPHSGPHKDLVWTFGNPGPPISSCGQTFCHLHCPLVMAEGRAMLPMPTGTNMRVHVGGGNIHSSCTRNILSVACSEGPRSKHARVRFEATTLIGYISLPERSEQEGCPCRPNSTTMEKAFPHVSTGVLFIVRRQGTGALCWP